VTGNPSGALSPATSVAAVIAVALFVLVVFAPTTLAVVDVWSRSSSYGHCVLVMPAFAWLVWQRRSVLATLPLRPSWRPMPLLAVAGAVWLAGRMMAIDLASQFALVSMVSLAVGIVVGTAWVRALAFPLAFLLLAVPFGDSWVPTLREWTADATVGALRLSGLHVRQDGTSFSTASDDWAVIEACSGMAFLLASLTVASLYAGTLYRSSIKRLAFVAVALTASIVANWIRAGLFVLLAAPTGEPTAMGIDHITFGWGVFGLVLSTVLFLGWCWRDDPMARDERDPGPAPIVAGSAPTSLSLCAPPTAIALLCVFSMLSAGGDPVTPQPRVDTVRLEARDGWVAGDDAAAASWRPVVHNALAEGDQSFVRDGQVVSVHLAVFGRPTRDSKLVTSSNSLTDPRDPRWMLVRRGSTDLQGQASAFAVRTSTLAGRHDRIVVWDWYWVDGTSTGSPLRARVAQMLARMQGRDETAAWVTVCTTERDGGTPGPRVLRGFASRMLPSIEEALEADRLAAAGARMSVDFRSPSPPNHEAFRVPTLDLTRSSARAEGPRL